VATALLGCQKKSEPSEAKGAAPGAEEQRPVREAAHATPVQTAVGQPTRPETDRMRDADRRPADVLDFFGIAPGMHVAELMTGKGYYAEILGHLIGPSGKLYAQNNKFVLEKFAEAEWAARLNRLSMPHVVRTDQELHELSFPADSLDAVLMILFYHDTYWMEVDRAAMNAAIFKALKPGGTYGIIDHHAAVGAGVSTVKTIHRIEASVVQKDVEDAGFVLDGSSDVLVHPEDARTLNVFDDNIRGKTDRFMYRFVKPAKQ